MTIHRIRLSKMQKVVNVLAVASAAVSLAVVGTVGYVFVNKDAIIQGVTDKAMESVLGGGLGGLGGGAAGDFGGAVPAELPTGANDLSPTTNPAAAPQASADVPF
jgi:hypothetical protein